MSGLVYAVALKVPPPLAGGDAKCKDHTGHRWRRSALQARLYGTMLLLQFFTTIKRRCNVWQM
jgi:hypothetical protein